MNVAGAEYVRAMAARRSDRLARTAFQQLVLRLVNPGDALFDFGAGPGIDARFYVERGLTVRAYDVDPAMCAYFAHECADLIQAGRVVLEEGPYAEFLRSRGDTAGRRARLVTANFAPLNLVGDLRTLFAKFHELTQTDGRVLVSVLSPCFVGDLRYRWWWRNVLRLWRTGDFSVPGAQAPIVRRRLASYASQCQPYFVLERVYRGFPPVSGGSRPGPWSWLRGTRSQFMFLQFRRG
jgi:SAM-dependent methyltransferase